MFFITSTRTFKDGAKENYCLGMFDTRRNGKRMIGGLSTWMDIQPAPRGIEDNDTDGPLVFMTREKAEKYLAAWLDGEPLPGTWTPEIREFIGSRYENAWIRKGKDFILWDLTEGETSIPDSLGD